MAMSAFPPMDAERVEKRRRRRALGFRQRRSKRQDVPPVEAPGEIESESEPGEISSESEDGVESESEDEAEVGEVEETDAPEIPASQVTAPPGLQPAASSAIASPPPPAAQITTSEGIILSTTTPAISASAPPPPSSPATTAISNSDAASPTGEQNTSIQGNQNSRPSASISTPTAALLTLSTSPSPTSIANDGQVLTLVTSTSMASVTATLLVPESTASRAANALGETNDASLTPSKNEGLSRGVETVIIVITVGFGIALVAFLGLYFYRRYRRQQFENGSSRSNATRSLWGGSDASSDHAIVPAMPPVPPGAVLPTFIPPAMQQTRRDDNPFADPVRHSVLSNSAADRQERLGRVRADLLAPRELSGGLMRSATQRQANPQQPNSRHIRSASGNNYIGDVGPAESSNPSAAVWPTGKVDANTMKPSERLDIEAGGQWDDSITIARYSRAETEMSMPHWRTPSQWVQDQTKRNQGMTRLP